MGKLYAVGFGPGGYEHMTAKAIDVIKNADVITGYTTYVEMLKKIFPDKEYVATPMTKEMDRCRMAVDLAAEGKTVAMVSSGDSGIYGMAGILLEIANEKKADVEIETVPGVTAAMGGAAVLGAPLGHDCCLISLSDLLTPWELIEKRLRAAAQADFLIALYNPSSKKRKDYLARACDILLEYKEESIICGIVRNIAREEESMNILTLKELRNTEVDMFSTVYIGNKMTKIIKHKMVTPRGYRYDRK